MQWWLLNFKGRWLPGRVDPLPMFPSDRDCFDKKAWGPGKVNAMGATEGLFRENEARASEGSRLFTTNVSSYGCFGENLIFVGVS